MKVSTSKISIASLGLALGVAACSAPQQREEASDEVLMKDATDREVPPQADPVRPARRVHDDEPQQPPEEDGELAVEMFEISPGRAATAEDGFTVRQHAGAPNYRFEVSRGGKSQAIEFSGSPLYYEGVAFGRLFVLSEFGQAVQVTLRSDVPGQPLSEQEAFDLARKERESRLGCQGREHTSALPNGTVVLSVTGDTGDLPPCRVIVGRFTRKVVDL